MSRHSSESFATRFNSRTLGRVRQSLQQPAQRVRKVSIHAPWEGCDSYVIAYPWGSPSFNSRTLGRVRRSTGNHLHYEVRFNSRTLGRVRRTPIAIVCSIDEFQFTHPGKGATRAAVFVTPAHRFNSRTLGRVRQHSARGFDHR